MDPRGRRTQGEVEDSPRALHETSSEGEQEALEAGPLAGTNGDQEALGAGLVAGADGVQETQQAVPEEAQERVWAGGYTSW